MKRVGLIAVRLLVAFTRLGGVEPISILRAFESAQGSSPSTNGPRYWSAIDGERFFALELARLCTGRSATVIDAYPADRRELRIGDF